MSRSRPLDIEKKNIFEETNNTFISDQNFKIIYGSISNNQWFSEQAAFQNSLKKMCYNFLVADCTNSARVYKW